MNTTGNYQKTPVGTSLSRIARQAVETAMHKVGKKLPCKVVAVDGSIVTVAFQINAPGLTLYNITIPVLGSEYARVPIQVGCMGYTTAADAYLGGMSALGGGVATLRQPGNMEALVFVPIGNAKWFNVDGNVYTLYGPGGVTLMDQGQTTFVNLTPGNVVVTAPTMISLTAGGHNITISAAGVVIDGIVFGTHEHGGVLTGPEKTTFPVNP